MFTVVEAWMDVQVSVTLFFQLFYMFKSIQNKHFEGKKRQLPQLLPIHLPIYLHLYPTKYYIFTMVCMIGFYPSFYSHYLQFIEAHHFHLPKGVSTAIFPSLSHILSVGLTDPSIYQCIYPLPVTLSSIQLNKY